MAGCALVGGCTDLQQVEERIAPPDGLRIVRGTVRIAAPEGRKAPSLSGCEYTSSTGRLSVAQPWRNVAVEDFRGYSPPDGTAG